MTNKIRENRLRRAAARQGLTLRKSPRRDHRARSYGTYMLTSTDSNGTVVVAAAEENGREGYGLTLDEVEQRLSW
jgi:hypothetical protein